MLESGGHATLLVSGLNWRAAAVDGETGRASIGRLTWWLESDSNDADEKKTREHPIAEVE